MAWIEMSRHHIHGDKTGQSSWSFGRCLWSPTKNKAGSKVRWWETMLKVKEGEAILHMRWHKGEPTLVGFSTAETDGFIESIERPPDPEQWSFAKNFYRVMLKDYVPFPSPILLHDAFSTRDADFRGYLKRNKLKPKSRRKALFYTLRDEKLVPNQGAYLSELDNELSGFLLSESMLQTGGETDRKSRGRVATEQVRTGEVIREFKARLGQREFSDNIRANYEHKCCFPDCPVVEEHFLRGAHIARWADVPELRGQTSNGLCLCLMHDKAFEDGYFTLTQDYRVAVNNRNEIVRSSIWCKTALIPYNGRKIHIPKDAIKPSPQAIERHWRRIKFQAVA